MTNTTTLTYNDLIEKTVNFISSICDNIKDNTNNTDNALSNYFGLDDGDLSSFCDNNNGNTLFGIKSTESSPFKVGYTYLDDESKIDTYNQTKIKDDLNDFLKKYGYNTENNNNIITKKQFLVLVSLISSFIYQSVAYFIMGDKMNVNLSTYKYSNDISDTVLIIYRSFNEQKNNIANLYNTELPNANDNIIKASDVVNLFNSLCNNYMAVDRVKSFQYAINICSSSSSSSCCSSSSCSSSSSSSYFIAYMQL